MEKSNKKIRISFVGDILPSNLPYTIGFGNYSKLNHEEIINHDIKPDIFFANLESPLSEKDGNGCSFSGNTKILDVFQGLGINIVTISNNHILEQGKEGFCETIKLLRANDIKVVGINENYSSNIESFSFENHIIAFAAFNDIHDIENPSLYADLNKEGIRLALERMENMKATFKVISFHWGNEFINMPNPNQIEIAKFAIENGCDIIIGHHPHVVQKIEMIKNKYVFYSLGNAYFDYLFDSTVKMGLRVNCELTKDETRISYNYISTKYKELRNIKGDTKSLIINEKDVLLINKPNYSNKYLSNLKRLRFLFRVKMKFHLLELLLTLPLSKKKILITNIINVFSTKLRK